THMVEIVSQAAGTDVGEIAKEHHKDKGVSLEMDRALAAASKGVVGNAGQTFQQIPQIIMQAMQMLKQMQQPNMPADPTALAVSQARSQDNKDKIASNEKIEGMRQQGAAQKDDKDNASSLQQTQVEQAGESARTEQEIAAREQINREDNSTALEIAAAKIETGHGTNISTGTSLMGHQGPESGGI